MDYELNMYDPLFNRTYLITLDQEDYDKACKDQAYAAVLLKHARDCFKEPEPTQLTHSFDTNKTISYNLEDNSVNCKVANILDSTTKMLHIEGTITGNNQSYPVVDPTLGLSTSTVSPERSVWTRKDILLLINLFKENQNLFKSTTIRKEVIWGNISKELNKLTNSNKSGDQCRNKFKYLKTMYLKKKDNMSTKGTGSQNLYFAYLSEMDEIFKKDHNVTPVATVSSLNNNFPEETSGKKEDTGEDVDDYNINEPAKKKSKLLLKQKEKPIIKILLERETNTERRHQENIQKKNEALHVCRQILNLAQNIIETKK